MTLNLNSLPKKKRKSKRDVRVFAVADDYTYGCGYIYTEQWDSLDEAAAKGQYIEVLFDTGKVKDCEAGSIHVFEGISPSACIQTYVEKVQGELMRSAPLKEYEKVVTDAGMDSASRVLVETLLCAYALRADGSNSYINKIVSVDSLVSLANRPWFNLYRAVTRPLPIKLAFSNIYRHLGSDTATAGMFGGLDYVIAQKLQDPENAVPGLPTVENLDFYQVIYPFASFRVFSVPKGLYNRAPSLDVLEILTATVMARSRKFGGVIKSLPVSQMFIDGGRTVGSGLLYFLACMGIVNYSYSDTDTRYTTFNAILNSWQSGSSVSASITNSIKTGELRKCQEQDWTGYVSSDVYLATSPPEIKQGA